jgi:hypothetical protein
MLVVDEPVGVVVYLAHWSVVLMLSLYVRGFRGLRFFEKNFEGFEFFFCSRSSLKFKQLLSAAVLAASLLHSSQEPLRLTLAQTVVLFKNSGGAVIF